MTITCRPDDLDPEFCATHEDGMFDVGDNECDIAGGYDPLNTPIPENSTQEES